MLTEKQLVHLATVMSEQDGTGSTRRIDAGYTYFGQFISHEIVAATPHQGDPPPTRIASPLLDLDSVYGTPDQMQTWLPGGVFATPAPPALPDDLVRNSGGVAHIPEPRNDDNVILAQLHRFWQRFHNLLLQPGLGLAANPVQARGFVTKVVQLLVVEDFLRQVLEPRVFASYFRSNERWLTFNTPGIPPHFSHAGYRFGHSMVRASYEAFAGGTERNLKDLLRQGRLDPKNVIDLKGFFGEPFENNRVQDAMAIDPFVARGMSFIPDPNMTIHIIKANLKAADSVNLPSGKVYVEQLLAGPKGPELQAKFGLAPLGDLGVLSQYIPSELGLTIDNLPLWPYVLVEAMSTAEGKRLGVLGSLICAEVIAGAIRQAPVSIYDGQWRSVDQVLATLETLGERLQAQRSANGSGPAPRRDFCMRHVIQLVLG
ncbi:MAG: peroxidase family protein [Steroidobacteraceae bacterium]